MTFFKKSKFHEANAKPKQFLWVYITKEEFLTNEERVVIKGYLKFHIPFYFIDFKRLMGLGPLIFSSSSSSRSCSPPPASLYVPMRQISNINSICILFGMLLHFTGILSCSVQRWRRRIWFPYWISGSALYIVGTVWWWWC